MLGAYAHGGGLWLIVAVVGALALAQEPPAPVGASAEARVDALLEIVRRVAAVYGERALSSSGAVIVYLQRDAAGISSLTSIGRRRHSIASLMSDR